MMATISSQRVFELLDKADEEIKEKEEKAHDISGKFDFNNVTFGYKSYRKVLKNITTSVEKGEMIGLVGHSGAGKSTMINLIMRLYNPDKGKILLDGINLSEYDENKYKASLGVVLQESYLFSGTILNNIKYASPDATLEDCIIAAKKANAHDFIMKLPDGYNTYVGEKGHKLSGGERQRISIARAIAANPKIIVFDEATASVDTETEIKIQQALKNVTEGKTVFAIAHRLSTLKNADRLIVIDDGKIAEEGTHSELMKKNGIYASLLKAQQEMITIEKEKKGEGEKWEI
jgi:ATP-binding cassette subfamily B protein